MFNFDGNGYKKSEVDAYVNESKSKLMDLQLKVLESERKMLAMQEEITKTAKKQKNINFSLTDALEKARKIEESSKNIYQLKIQQLNILYSKWRVLLNEMMSKYPEIEDTKNIAKLIEEFKISLKMAQKDELESNQTTLVQTENDPIRLLLGKMTTYIKKTEEPKEIKQERRSVLEVPYSRNERTMIKPIVNIELSDEEEGYENLVDKFLMTKPDEEGLLKRKAEEVNGFDLKEAVNPKENLEEIMKAFDFYNGSDNN